MSSSSLPFAIPSSADGGWIAPYYAEVFGSIAAGGSPYLSLLNILKYLYYPKTNQGFRIQLWILIGLFAFTMTIILLGLALRAYQGRMWLFHRMDRTVVIPGGALFPICSLAYAALGLLVVVGAIQISNFRTPYPTWYMGIRAAWIGALWTGIFFEVWACYAGWYIRRYGAHFRESTPKTIIALLIPVLIVIVAWVPPTVFYVLGSMSFNRAVRASRVVNDLLVEWQQTWTPAKGIELDKFAGLFEIGAEMGGGLLTYGDWYTRGALYVAAVLIVTLVAYLIGAALEINHLSRTIRRLKAEHNLGLNPRATSNVKSRFSAFSNSVLGREAKPDDIDEQLDDEYARGQGKGRRQWELMEWVRTNRVLTTACIAALLCAETGLALWKGFTSVTYETPSAQFMTNVLLSGWLNSLLSTLVSLLILFRSLDGSSPLVDRLRTLLPFVPFPPSLERRSPTSGSVSNGPPKHRVYNGEKSVMKEEAVLDLREGPRQAARHGLGFGDEVLEIGPPALDEKKKTNRDEIDHLDVVMEERVMVESSWSGDDKYPPSREASHRGSSPSHSSKLRRVPVPTLDREYGMPPGAGSSASGTDRGSVVESVADSDLLMDDDSAVDKDADSTTHV
ncbi:hypothetical protein JCM10212_000659 [Sporobolomyces blumeae]